jgi:hypothetical protein
MSDQDVVIALDAMERMLQHGEMTGGSLAPWQAQFDAAVASAERGPGWADIAQRSQLLGRRVDLALAGVLADRDLLKKRLHLLAVGGRALKGYSPGKR